MSTFLSLIHIFRLLQAFASFAPETGTGVVPINAKCKIRQRQKIDPVSILQNIQIPITGTDPDHIGNAASLPCCRPHPEHIMIAPLNIH